MQIPIRVVENTNVKIWTLSNNNETIEYPHNIPREILVKAGIKSFKFLKKKIKSPNKNSVDKIQIVLKSECAHKGEKLWKR